MAERFDGVHVGGAPRGIKPENDAHGRGNLVPLEYGCRKDGDGSLNTESRCHSNEQTQRKTAGDLLGVAPNLQKSSVGLLRKASQCLGFFSP